MRVVQINSVCSLGSTGRICQSISECLNKMNIENYILYSWGETNYTQAIKCTELFPKYQAFLSRIKGNYGFNSNKTTEKMISELERIKPNIVHLHNLHSHNCNLEILISYFAQNNISVIWTFHDCWVFTAYCPHYVMEKCYKWKNGCYQCSQYRKFSWFKDNSQQLFSRKKKLFHNLELTIVTPSKWLANEVKQSFLKNYPIKVISNGINLSVFKPKESDFREKYKITDKFIILGVAIQWVPRKGPDVFIELSRRLDLEKFQIILVGTDEKIEKIIPKNIICVRRTRDAHELADIYSCADLFVNPTREDTYPTVNMEAMACGTPVISFDTGGSKEMITSKCGCVVNCDDIDELEKEIVRIERYRPFERQECVKRAKEFDENSKYMEYVDLYNEIYLGEEKRYG